MSLPKQVQKQSEDVQALYKELNKETAEAPAGLDSGEKVPEEKQAETDPEDPQDVPTIRHGQLWRYRCGRALQSAE